MPLEGDGFLAAGRVVTDELDVGIFVEVWVGVEFEGDEILDFSCCGSCDICEAIDDCVDKRLSVI